MAARLCAPRLAVRAAWIAALTMLLAIVGCAKKPAPAAEAPVAEKKTGVLLVSHGSRSATWRKALEELGERVRGPILAGGKVKEVKSAFMEHTEPSIATRLKEFDRDGFSDVVVVPVFLTVSPHPFDDIPTIMGQKTDPQSLETIKVEGIERYTPRARVHLTPLLDFTDLLQKNILRRVKSLSTDAAKEGLVLVAYGDETYEKEWTKLLEKVAAHVGEQTGIKTSAHAWCGHIVRYDPKKTTAAIEQVLKTRERALVIPVLVAHDEHFQVKIIGDGIAAVAGSKEKVAYRPDAILPDDNLDQWVIRATMERATSLEAGGGLVQR